MTSSDPNYLPKSQLPNTIILGIRTGFPGGTVVRNPPASAEDVEDRDVSLIPGWGKIRWRWEWQPAQYCCLENPLDRGRSLVGYGPCGGKESDMTEHTAAQGFGPQHVNFRGTQMFSPAHLLSPLLTVAQLSGHFLKRPFTNTCLTLMSEHYLLSFCVAPYSITEFSSYVVRSMKARTLTFHHNCNPEPSAIPHGGVDQMKDEEMEGAMNLVLWITELTSLSLDFLANRCLTLLLRKLNVVVHGSAELVIGRVSLL